MKVKINFLSKRNHFLTVQNYIINYYYLLLHPSLYQTLHQLTP